MKIVKTGLTYAIFAILALTTLHAADDQYRSNYPAILEPLRLTHLYAENQSSIYYEMYTPATEITKKLGDPVHQGEVLIRFEDAVSKANVAKTRSDLARAHVDLTVKRALFQDSLISELELKEAEASVAGTEFSLILAEKNYAASVIHAPYDGKVSDLFIHLYELPERGKPLMDVIDDSILIAKLLIPARVASSLKIGDPVFIQLIDSGQIIETQVKRMSPTVNPASGTVKIEAELDNHDSHLKAGMVSFAAFKREALTNQQLSIDEILQELKAQQPQHQ